MERRLLRSRSAPSPPPGLPLPPAAWSVLVLIAAADAVVATDDFVVRPLFASPPDLPAALRGSVVLAILGVGAARLLRRPPAAEPARAAPTASSGPPTGTEALLASLADLPAGTGDAPPTLAVHVGDPLVEVFWGGPPLSPPSPWRSSETGWVWEADRRQLVPARSLDRRRWARLVAVGATPTGTLWLNLAGFRVIALAGDDAAVTRRAAAIVRVLQRRAESGVLELVVLDGPGSELGVAPSPMAVEQVLATLWRRSARRRDEVGLAARARRRSHRRDPLVVVAPAHADAERLVAAARVEPSATVLVMGDLDTADLRLRCAAGQVTVPFLGDLALRVTDPAPPSTPTTDLASPGDADERPPSSTEQRGGAADGADTVEVRVLGPIEVHGAAGALVGKSLELVVYLACHPDGVHDEQIRAALWPDHPPAPATWAQRVSVTRRALGVDVDGRPRLLRFRRHVGRLAPSVRTDVGRLDAALAECRDAPGEATDDALAALLDGVRGRPFDAARGYGWANEEQHVQHAEQAVIDAAHHLAERAIQAGDWERALRASERGLRACPSSDLLLSDREQAARIGGVSTGTLATRALRDALRDLDPRLGLTLPGADGEVSRVTDLDS